MLALPTEQRQAEKIRVRIANEKGLKLRVRKKQHQVEQHFDDCGNHWSGLGKDFVWIDGYEDDDGYESYDDSDRFDAHWFGGLSGTSDTIQVAVREIDNVKVFPSATSLEI